VIRQLPLQAVFRGICEYVRRDQQQAERGREQACRVAFASRARAIGPAEIEAYKAKKLGAGLSPKSINNHLTVLALRTGHRQGELLALRWELRFASRDARRRSQGGAGAARAQRDRDDDALRAPEPRRASGRGASTGPAGLRAGSGCPNRSPGHDWGTIERKVARNAEGSGGGVGN